MSLLIAEVFAVIPALLLVWYYYRQDTRKPEPKGLILNVFALGFVVTIPVIVVELALGVGERALHDIPLLYHFFRAFVVAALCEEWFKLQVVKHAAYRSVHFDEIMDGIVYTVTASLGFACLENILYVLDGGLQVALLRAFTAVPMHALASGMMGYYIGLAKFAANPRRERALFRTGLWAAVVIHGVYNFLLFAGPDIHPLISFGIFPLLIVVFFMLRQNITLALAADARHGRGVVPPPLPPEP
jgi:protease PrsW